jgi:tyrosyl-tRNA synthetase
LNLAQHFSVQQLIERDIFQERMKKSEPINLREFLYPLLQGYDSVMMKVDLELGGTDQTFNMLAGRSLVQSMLHREKFVMTVPLLSDATGRKIGKSEGNVIGITDPVNEFYGKIMALGDEAILPALTILTDTELEEIERIKQAIEAGENPMLFKKRLAFELTKQFNSEEEALEAQDHFENTFQKGDLSSVNEFPISKLPNNPLPIIELLVSTGSASSNSAARRLVEDQAVEIDQIVVDMVQTNVTLKSGMTMRVGKKRFLKFT